MSKYRLIEDHEERICATASTRRSQRWRPSAESDRTF